MTPSLLFNVIAALGGIGWFAVIVLSPFWKHTDRFVLGIVVAIIAVIYSFLNMGHIGDVGGPIEFLTFPGVKKIFENPYLVVGGYAHILAFDLIVAIWIKHNAARHEIPYWMVVLVFLLSISFAPMGLLAYFLVRLIKTKKYFLGF